MKTICISQQDDGTFSVYEEKPEGMDDHQMPDGSTMQGDMGSTAAPTAMPGMPPAEETAPPEAQPAASLDEALDAARAMFEGDSGEMSVEQAFQGGFEGKPAKGAY